MWKATNTQGNGGVMNHSQPCPDLIIYIYIGGKLPTPRAMVV